MKLWRKATSLLLSLCIISVLCIPVNAAETGSTTTLTILNSSTFPIEYNKTPQVTNDFKYVLYRYSNKWYVYNMERGLEATVSDITDRELNGDNSRSIFSPDGTKAVVKSLMQHSIAIVDLAAASAKEYHFDFPVREVYFCGSMLWVVGEDHKTDTWWAYKLDPETGDFIDKTEPSQEWYQTPSPSGQLLWNLTENGILKIRSVNDFSLIHTLDLSSWKKPKVAFSNDDRRMAVSSGFKDSGKTVIYDTATFEPVAEVNYGNEYRNDDNVIYEYLTSFSPDNKTVIIGDSYFCEDENYVVRHEITSGSGYFDISGRYLCHNIGYGLNICDAKPITTRLVAVSITPHDPNVDLTKTKTLTLNLQGTYSDGSTKAIPGSDVKWTLGDFSFGKVENGQLTIQSKGNCKLTASYSNLSDTVMITAAYEEGLSNFRPVNNYQSTTFSDVSSSSWYSNNVGKAYTLGLMKGVGGSAFGVSGNVTLAETIAMACRLNSIYYTGSDEFTQTGVWYQVYVDYARQAGITSEVFRDYNSPATRAQFAVILSAALPEQALSPVNTLSDNSIPDVTTQQSYSGPVYSFYRAGIMTGSDKAGTFHPETSISRVEAAAVLTRMADTSLRIHLG